MNAGIKDINIASIGPNILPCWAKFIPSPKANIRTVPWKKESPTPDKGPINDVFIALIDSGLKFSLSA